MQLTIMFQNLGFPFMLIWIGSTISTVGTSTATFALSIWVFQKTGSVLDFSWMLVASSIPRLFILPFAGSIVDRFNRLHVLVLSNIAAAMMTLILALVLYLDIAKFWYFYIYIFFTSIAGAFLSPAYRTAASATLHKDQLLRANGLLGTSNSMISIFAPLMAGGLLAKIGLTGIVLLDFATFCIGSVIVLKAVIPVPLSCVASAKSLSHSALKDFFAAMNFFKIQPLMLGLLIYIVIQDTLLALVTSMITPLVLSKYSAIDLGWIMTWGGIGSLIGAGLLVVKGNHKRLMATILVCTFTLSLCIISVGGFDSLIVYSICAFIAMLAGSVGEGCNEALWMRKVPIECQGRIFALLSTIMTVSVPIVAILGGFLADYIFEPAIISGGVMQRFFGPFLDTSKGCGIELLYIICGILGIMLTFCALLNKNLLNIENIVIDGR